MRHFLHKLIIWHLHRCAGAFHAYPYGERGRYVVLMTDSDYHYYKTLAAGLTPEEFHRRVWAIRESDPLRIVEDDWGDDHNPR